MGLAIADDTLNDTINILSKVSISSANTCVVKLNETQSLVIVDCQKENKPSDKCTIDIHNVNFNEIGIVKQNCVSKAIDTAKLQADLKVVINQIASSITQALAFGGTDSKILNNNITNISEDVISSFKSKCIGKYKTKEKVQIDGNGPIYFYHIKFDETIENVQNCILDEVSNTDNTIKFTQQITQKATAKAEGLLGGLMAIVIIILIVIGGLVLEGGKALGNPKFWIAIVSVALIYLGLAYGLKWEPFSKSGKAPNANTKVDNDLIV